MPISFLIILMLCGFITSVLATLDAFFGLSWCREKYTKVALVSSIVTLLLSQWFISAITLWPYTDLEKPIIIHHNRAYISILEKDEVLVKKSENEIASFDEDNYINVNELFGRQFCDGEKMKLRIYKSMFMGLSSFTKFKVGDIYISGGN